MPQKPWIFPRLLKSINEKNRLNKIKCNYPSDENIQKFKLYKNTLTRTLKESERNYYEKEISSAASQQKMWEILRDKLNKNKPRAISTFLKNGNDANKSTEKKRISQNYLLSISVKLVKNWLEIFRISHQIIHDLCPKTMINHCICYQYHLMDTKKLLVI